MGGRWHPRGLVLPILLLWTTGSALGLALEIGGNGGALVVSTVGFPPKAQLGGDLWAGFSIPFTNWLSLSASVGALGEKPSDTQAGFSYRGYSGGDVALALAVRFPVAAWQSIGVLGVGGDLGVAGVLAVYEYSSLYFFYPEARFDGFLDFRPAWLPAVTFRLLVPFRAGFRRDLYYAMSLGLGLAVSLSLWGQP